MFCFSFSSVCFRMVSLYTCLLVLLSSVMVMLTRGKTVRPNIVLIVADDMGWDDVSFHGSTQTLTPNIDLMAYRGVALERYYSHCVCTPSRAALLTSKFAYKTGMHGYPLTYGEDRGVPLTEKLLPQYLKELGYSTHLVGKWHLGQSRTAFLPTSRGFDTHFGHRGGYIDYYEYTSEETWSTGEVYGFDLYRNDTAAWDIEGYITDIYTEQAKSIIADHDETSPLFMMVTHNAPHSGNAGAVLQAPPEDVRAMRHVESPERRIYAAMVKKLDDSIGDIVQALQDKQILDNTVIVFIADNGGMTSGLSLNYASNWSLRGLKFSPFEGGIRVAGLLWAPMVNISNHLWKGYMHVVDWMPTLLRAAGADPPSGLDGIDLWNNIALNKESSRNEMFEIDDYSNFYSIISGDYKLITGTVNKEYSNHWGSDLRGVIGDGPSYLDAIKRSKMYSVLEKMGKSFEMDEAEIRNNIRVDCKVKEDKKENIGCPSDDGSVCLFNIKEDPCETKDLSKSLPDVVKRMLARLQVEVDKEVKKGPPFRDPRALPRLFNFTWSVWADSI